MLMDWFTVGAQALNFIILVWLMKKFLYHPILNAIDAREKKIALEIKNADDKKAEAQKEHEEFKKKNEDFDQNRVLLLNKMTEEIKTERLRQLEEVRVEANNLKVKRQESLESSTKNLFESIKHKIELEVFGISRKVLTDLSTSSLENNICQIFIQRLQTLAPEVKKEFIESIKSDHAVLRTYFNLPEDQRIKLGNAINESFSSKVNLQFETSPEIIGGIEFLVQGKKISWCIGDYLQTMEQSLKDLSHEH
jgi:F-type H+-transporting ATPase subunit b